MGGFGSLDGLFFGALGRGGSRLCVSVELGLLSGWCI
jgi:hypothetical protein